MKKDLRFLQTLILLNLLPLIPFLQYKYVIYILWAVSLTLISVHLIYYLTRSVQATLLYTSNKNPENKQSMAHFCWNFIIMFFAYTLSSWMLYVSFKYTEIV